MNRSIKFRGKRIDNGNWVYGFYISDKADDCFIAKYDSLNERFQYRVNEETVGQYIGLNDKNGNPIYEGDILKSPYFEDECVPVIWNTKHAQFTFGGAEFNVEAKPENLEVLGNIYENKDLLNNNP